MNLIWAILFIAGGFILRFQINKRQFNRRNMAGVEEFKSYGNAYATQMIEKVGRYVGFFLIVFGIIMAISFFFRSSNSSHDTNRKKVEHYKAQ
ncbi:hypothetical protein MUGA111182_03385 [Mucilaginibacter galii]|uniref:Molybdenum ABC transporter permease n=1 Tax=Mucilaginibacter galii TaxID=2005073 RepID=A0A917N130_9SPHI|nr:hypothetical protein [Mucilaginibacter galii]GGI50433.1 hypothetical protein GCM10011425_16450 [Mucilaginibacter galii]